MDANATRVALQVALAISETIRQAGSIPSGHVYAAVMGTVPFAAYTSIIDALVRAKLVRRDGNHLLTWIGPVLKDGTDVS